MSGLSMVWLLRLLKTFLFLLSAFLFAFFAQGFLLKYQNIHPVFQADFFQYWTAAKVFLMGLNPYDTDIVLNFQRIHWFGSSYPEPIMLWYPPIALTLILPFAFFNFEFAAGLWFFCNIILLIYLIKRLSCFFKLESKFIQIAILAVISAPVLYNLIDGQISFFLLAGLSFFLLYRELPGVKSQCFAGFALSLTLIKPHLLFLLFLVIIIKSCKEKKFAILTGMFAGLILLSILPALINPNILSYYVEASSNPPIDFRTPTLGSWLQSLTDIHLLIIRLLPTILISLSLIVYLLYKKTWSADLLIYLLPFSLLFSPYGWNNDQVLLLPLIILLLEKFKYLNGYLYILLLGLQLFSVFLLRFSQEFHIIYPLVLIIIMAGISVLKPASVIYSKNEG